MEFNALRAKCVNPESLPPSLSLSRAAQLSDHEVNFMFEIQFSYGPHSHTAGGKQPLKRNPDVSEASCPWGLQSLCP